MTNCIKLLSLSFFLVPTCHFFFEVGNFFIQLPQALRREDVMQYRPGSLEPDLRNCEFHRKFLFFKKTPLIWRHIWRYIYNMLIFSKFDDHLFGLIDQIKKSTLCIHIQHPEMPRGPDTYHFEIEHIDSPSYPGPTGGP